MKPKATMLATALDEFEPEEELNDLQKSLVGLSDFLELETPPNSRRHSRQLPNSNPKAKWLVNESMRFFGINKRLPIQRFPLKVKVA